MSVLISPKATDSLETWLSYLEKSHFKPIDMGLERIRLVAEQLDLLKPAPYVITVAGTNGKGSTCKLLETALLKAGKRVGVYSSPHLIHYNERVRVQGEMVSDKILVRTFHHIEQHKTASLTYFEFGTLAALDIFRRAELDVVILEVGLGGRLDATNIVEPSLAIITSIDIDHIEFLGDNREAIGREKAGIFRPDIPVVIGEPDCPDSVLEYAKSLNCNVFQRDLDWQFSLLSDSLQWQSAQHHFELPLPQIPAPNVATAVAALTQLPFAVDQAVIKEAVFATEMVGRFQRLTERDFAKFSGKRPLAQVIVDVGHNPHAARYLAERLQAQTLQGKVYALFSVLVDKDLSGIVEPLDKRIDEWHCAGLSGVRGQSGEAVLAKLTAKLPQATAVGYPDMATAAQVLFGRVGEQDTVIVFGSFHTVADFLLYLER
ncbi:folylpolyglutamate synthase [[Actinobacillus] muris]|uniref:Dihydrofolate synthase/folylpolyglutamate synthase n=1 Tax=Muribacter muris TaxID=67855 RepID=A0A0J5S4R3_9PAST|nr:bifunctional tetrahydrofolate synthase/dihydrofolate synthase [Muribacter muris]KMK51777.1 folylpolyglutamate synthase [[Actinobacillus] muris] [Muribacter muris]